MYNFNTTHVSSASPPPLRTATGEGASAPALSRGTSARLPPGHDIYDRLDRHFVDLAHELLLGAPLDDSALVHYLVPCFIRYSTDAQPINRLLNYVNRQYVRRADDEDTSESPSLQRAPHWGPTRGAAAGPEMMGRAAQACTNKSRRRYPSTVLRSCIGGECRRVEWPSSLCWPRRARRQQACWSTCQSSAGSYGFPTATSRQVSQFARRKIDSCFPSVSQIPVRIKHILSTVSPAVFSPSAWVPVSESIFSSSNSCMSIIPISEVFIIESNWNLEKSALSILIFMSKGSAVTLA